MRTAAQAATGCTFTQLTKQVHEHDGPQLSKPKWQVVIRALVGSGHLYYRFQRSTNLTSKVTFQLCRVGPLARAAGGVAQAQQLVAAFIARDFLQDMEDTSRAHGGFFDVPELPAVLQGNTHPWVAAATAAQRAQVNAMVDRLASAVPSQFLIAHRARTLPLSALPYSQ